MQVNTFASLQLCAPLQQALAEKNYTEPSPIQAKAIPHLLENRDLIGCAQTGTGKTAAFALPILHRLSTHPRMLAPKQIRVLVLTPTRELASQIGASFKAYGKHLKLTSSVVFGGVGIGNQIRALSRGLDILVATPGRLLDLCQQNQLRLDAVEVFVLDEADRMLDMGFVHDVKRVIARLPAKRQSLLFSATMPPVIQELAESLLQNPVKVEAAPVATTAERIEQGVCFVGRDDKRSLLLHYLAKHPEGLVLVFVRMKHAANRLVEQLAKEGVRADAIHGNKSQGARERALSNFRSGQTRILIATDIAARGIDVKGIRLVINFDLSEEPEAYVHRIGRTARAGADGMAIAFCDRSERGLLRTIERLIRQPIPVLRDHPFFRPEEENAPIQDSPRGGGRQGGRGQGGGNNRFQRGGGGSGGSRFSRPAQGGQRSEGGPRGGHAGGGRSSSFRPARQAR